MTDQRTVCYACELNPQEYKLLNSNRKYPEPDGDTYYWHLSNFTPDMDKYKIILAYEKMIAIWQRAMDLVEPVGSYIQFKSTEDISQAHFIISFGPMTHEFPTRKGTKHTCAFNFDGPGGVLAHAWDLVVKQPYGGQMHMDESEKWGSMHSVHNGTMMTHLLTVGLHEFGHILGLDHSQIQAAVMFGGYTGEKASLHPDDQAGLAARFGPVKKKVYELMYLKNEQTDKPAKTKPPVVEEPEPKPQPPKKRLTLADWWAILWGR